MFMSDATRKSGPLNKQHRGTLFTDLTFARRVELTFGKMFGARNTFPCIISDF